MMLSDQFEFVRRKAHQVRLNRYLKQLERTGGNAEQIQAVQKEIDELDAMDNRPKVSDK